MIENKLIKDYHKKYKNFTLKNYFYLFILKL